MIPGGLVAKWEKAYPSVSCAKMRWRSTTTRRHVELRLQKIRLSETGCGSFLFRIPMAIASTLKALRMSPRRQSTHHKTNNQQIGVCLSPCRHGGSPPNDAFRETLHFLKLRAELQQHKVNADCLELSDPFGDLLRRSNQAGA